MRAWNTVATAQVHQSAHRPLAYARTISGSPVRTHASISGTLTSLISADYNSDASGAIDYGAGGPISSLTGTGKGETIDLQLMGGFSNQFAPLLRRE